MSVRARNLRQAEFLEFWANKRGISYDEAKEIFDSLTEAVTQCLSSGRGIRFRGFGLYELIAVPAQLRRSYLPTLQKEEIGAQYTHPPRWKVQVKISPVMTEIVNRILGPPSESDLEERNDHKKRGT